MVPFIFHLLRACWLPVASFFAGVLNTIAGGGSFLSLPALLASTMAAGVGAVSAQATNTVALWPGQLTSLVAFRHQLRTYRWELLPLGLASGLGGLTGGWLLLHTGNKRFRELLPWLLLFAAVMFVLSFPLGKWLATLSGGRRYNTTLLIGMVVVSARKIDLLRQSLGALAPGVQFADMDDIGLNPARIIPAWTEFVAAHDGRPVRGRPVRTCPSTAASRWRAAVLSEWTKKSSSANTSRCSSSRTRSP